MVVRPQLIPAVAVAVIAIGGIRVRAHYPALLGGLALPIVLSGLLDWITWGWPFHAYLRMSMTTSKVVVRSPAATRSTPLLAGNGCAWGVFGIVIVPCAIYGGLRLPLLFWVSRPSS